MNIWNNFQTVDGRQIRFRRKHQSESFAGSPGIYAVTVVRDLEVQALCFHAANDLAEADESNLKVKDFYCRLLRHGELGVSVCIMPRSDHVGRAAIALALEGAINDEERHAAA
ncbi:MAG: hypothetical protein JY451_05000 [Erythrobacter sp.]|nr:MAG: hypothetical protein JY451_05000 [Erythrobacter sp.]